MIEHADLSTISQIWITISNITIYLSDERTVYREEYIPKLIRLLRKVTSTGEVLEATIFEFRDLYEKSKASMFYWERLRAHRIKKELIQLRATQVQIHKKYILAKPNEFDVSELTKKEKNSLEYISKTLKAFVV